MKKFLIVAPVLFFTFVVFVAERQTQESQEPENPGPEIEAILSLSSAERQEPHLLKLIERVGVAQAQEELYRSGLPFTGESHLLVHTIGEYIYENFGSEGLSLCRDYFLSACYHAFIINDLADNGIEGLAETVEQCSRGGRHVLAQCAHAAGHGFVAWNDYDLLASLGMCDRLGEGAEGIPLFNCYDGVFMENLWGVHGGGPSPKRWVKEEDPYYPCNDPRIPDKYLGGCWSNQGSLMFQMYNGDLEKVAGLCNAVSDGQYREICYNSFARQIHPLTEGRADLAFEYCGAATNEYWRNYCVETIMESAFSVGDQEVMPYEICPGVSDLEEPYCYERLFGLIYSYSEGLERAKLLCGKITEESYREECFDFQERQGFN